MRTATMIPTIWKVLTGRSISALTVSRLSLFASLLESMQSVDELAVDKMMNLNTDPLRADSWWYCVNSTCYGAVLSEKVVLSEIPMTLFRAVMIARSWWFGIRLGPASDETATPVSGSYLQSTMKVLATGYWGGEWNHYVSAFKAWIIAISMPGEQMSACRWAKQSRRSQYLHVSRCFSIASRS